MKCLDTTDKHLSGIFKGRRIIHVRAMNSELALDGSLIQAMLLYEQIKFIDQRVAQFDNQFLPIFDLRFSHEACAQSSERGNLLVMPFLGRKIGVMVEEIISVFTVSPLEIGVLSSKYRRYHYALGKLSIHGEEVLLIDLMQLLKPQLNTFRRC